MAKASAIYEKLLSAPHKAVRFRDFEKALVEGVRLEAPGMTGHRYHINVFWSDEDGCWIASVPDLHPCSAHGETALEAVTEVGVAIELWLDWAREKGAPIPEAAYRPSSPEERADKEAA